MGIHNTLIIFLIEYRGNLVINQYDQCDEISNIALINILILAFHPKIWQCQKNIALKPEIGIGIITKLVLVILASSITVYNRHNSVGHISFPYFW